MTSDWARQIDAIVERQAPLMVEARRRLHAFPEPSGEEWRTTRYLGDLLAEAGYQARRGSDERGLIVDPPITAAGRRLLLRADIDALRLREERPDAFVSQVQGIMHGCGHDAHAAILLGALRALLEAHQEGVLPWTFRWRGVFQPAEETNQGALEMIASGAMDDVAAVIALHVDPSRPVGTIGTRVGPFTAACDDLEIVVEGRGGHAGRPHESIDPIAVAAQLVSSIYLFVPRGIDSHEPVVVTFGQINGGDSPNVIPSRVVLRGTVRTLGQVVREKTKDHIRQLARGLAEASGARIQVQFQAGPESVHNDPDLTALFHRAAADLLGAGNVQAISRASMGGEDFAHYLRLAPGAMFRLGCCGESGGCPPLHSPLFNPDERCLSIGAKILVRTAVLWSDPRPFP
jgi:amidohydrolase